MTCRRQSLTVFEMPALGHRGTLLSQDKYLLPPYPKIQLTLKLGDAGRILHILEWTATGCDWNWLCLLHGLSLQCWQSVK